MKAKIVKQPVDSSAKRLLHIGCVIEVEERDGKYFHQYRALELPLEEDEFIEQTSEFSDG